MVVVCLPTTFRHSLMVTSMGTIYSSGEGSDGALGHGGQQNSDEFRLIEW